MRPMHEYLQVGRSLPANMDSKPRYSTGRISLSSFKVKVGWWWEKEWGLLK